jgi:preprotein translocase subunit YajC
MVQILSLLVFIWAIWYMISVKGKAKAGQVQDQLSGSEKLYIWIAAFLNPIFSGAVFYYGWKGTLPGKAKQANAISLWAFLILIVVGIAYFVLVAPDALMH